MSRNNMHLIWAFLQTAGRDAPLYHATSLYNALSILDQDTLWGGVDYKTTENKVYQQSGVSLTRDRRFAERWEQIVLVLDQTKLAKNRKLVPRDFFFDESYEKSLGSRSLYDKRVQSEEFVPGKISPISNYLIKIYVSPKFMRELTHNLRFKENREKIWGLIHHPKFDSEQHLTIMAELDKMESNVTAGRDSPLYHRTPLDNINNILRDNAIKLKTKFRNSTFISLTRNKDFAERFKDGGAVLVLDQAKLAQTYKFKPIDFHGGYRINYTTPNIIKHNPERARNESEERVFKDIAPLDKYLLGVYLTKSIMEKIEQLVPQDHEYFQDLINHPKFDPKQRHIIQGLIDAQDLVTARLAGRDAPLYHRTDLESIGNILRHNQIDGRGAYNSVSLTRNRDFANKFRNGGVVLILDQTKLAQKYKMTPIDFWGQPWINQPMEDWYKYPANRKTTPEHRRNESEERIEGDLTNLDRYLIGLYFTPNMLDHIPKLIQQTPEYMRDVIMHPKFDSKQREMFLPMIQEAMKHVEV